MPSHPTLRSIAMFSPNPSAYYVSLLMGMRKEFFKRGIDAHVGLNYLDSNSLPLFCEAFKPDAILEIDRSRNSAEGMPRDIPSIAWIQDWRSVRSGDEVGLASENMGGSDLYYFLADPDSLAFDPKKLGHWDYLFLATDPETFYPDGSRIQSDFSFVGYIPHKRHLPISEQRLEASLLNAANVDPGTVGDLVDAMCDAGLTWNKYHASDARKFINDYIYAKLRPTGGLRNRLYSVASNFAMPLRNNLDCMIDDELMYSIENFLLRALGRKGVVDAVLQVSNSLRIFGIGEWESYPEYAAFFRGPLRTDGEVRQVNCSSKLNLHNAMTQMHSRVLNCMACQRPMMVNKMHTTEPNQPGSLERFFESGVHYIEYDDGDLTEVAAEALKDEERCKKIARAAYQEVLAHHTWADRVDQIISDMAQI